MRLIRETLTGFGHAVRSRFGTFAVASIVVGTLSILVPPVLLSVVRKPVDFWTVNPWLRRLPEYLASPEHTPWTKVEKLSNLALFWFSADSAYGGTEWGFAVDVADLARIALVSMLVGVYLALWTERRVGPARAGGIMGALAGVASLSTGPCSVVGCGAPVLPVVGLAFTGLSSGTLKLLSGFSSVATAAIILLLLAATAHASWRLGSERRRGCLVPASRA